MNWARGGQRLEQRASGKNAQAKAGAHDGSRSRELTSSVIPDERGWAEREGAEGQQGVGETLVGVSTPAFK